MDIVFSFIIPHYGIPELLQRCLSSIPRREDVQVIVVDDGSPDYDTYPTRFPELFRPGIEWIRAHHNGAGHARNLGLEKAVGKWVLFVDADDFYTDDFAIFLEDNEDAPEDVLFFRNICVMSDNPDERSKRSNWSALLFDQYAEDGDLRSLMFNHCSPWGKMIRSELLADNQIRFDEIRYSNDVVFSTLVASKAKTARVVDHAYYVLTEREGSLTSNRMRKPGELEMRADAALRAQKIAQDAGFGEMLFPLHHYLYKMLYYDRKLFRKFFRRIPEVYPSYWIPVREMADKERSPLRKAFVYTYSLFTRLTTR